MTYSSFVWGEAGTSEYTALCVKLQETFGREAYLISFPPGVKLPKGHPVVEMSEGPDIIVEGSLELVIQMLRRTKCAVGIARIFESDTTRLHANAVLARDEAADTGKRYCVCLSV